MTRNIRQLALVLVIQALGVVAAEAQLSTVQGRVRDVEGSAVYGATISLFSAQTRAFVTETDRLGSFRLEDVTSGQWEVQVTALGYTAYTEVLEVGVTQVEELDIRLQRSALMLEGIEVEAERSRDRIRFEELGGATVRELDLDEIRVVPGVAEPDPVRAIEVLPGVVSTSDFSAAFHVRGLSLIHI